VVNETEAQEPGQNTTALSVEVKVLREQLELQEQAVKRLELKVQQEAELRQYAEGELEEHRADIVEQGCEQAELQREVTSLVHERDKLRGELARGKADVVSRERAFKEVERQLAEQKKLTQSAALSTSKDKKMGQLREQLEAKAQDIKSLREQLAEARSAVQKSAQGLTVADGHQQLSQQLLLAQRGQAFCEERCWHLEEQIADRDCRIEEAQAEIRRLSTRLAEDEQKRQQQQQQQQEEQEQQDQEEKQDKQRVDFTISAHPCFPAEMAGHVGGSKVPVSSQRLEEGSHYAVEAFNMRDITEHNKELVLHVRLLEEALNAQGKLLTNAKAQAGSLKEQLTASLQVLAEFEIAAAALHTRLEKGPIKRTWYAAGRKPLEVTTRGHSRVVTSQDEQTQRVLRASGSRQIRT